MDSFEIWPVKRFAYELDVGLNTAKRLFERGVFEREWLNLTPGGHWRVEMSADRLEIARKDLTRWRLFYRKPDAASSKPNPSAIEDLVWEILLCRAFDQALTKDNWPLHESSPQRHRESDSKFDEDWHSFMELLLSQGGGAFYGSVKAELVKEMETNESGPAILELLAAHLAVAKKWGAGYDPTQSDLAEELCCSRRSLYRSPFGVECLKQADNLRKGFLEPPDNIDNFADSLPREPTVQEIREVYFVSETVATDLLDDWKAKQDSPHQESSFEFENYSEQERADFAKSRLARVHSQDREQRRPSAAEAKRRRSRDIERNRQRNEYLLRWKLETDGFPTLFLYAERSYEIKKLEDAKAGLIKPTAEQIEQWKFNLENEPGCVSMGCIFQDSNRSFVWRLFEGAADEGEERTYDSALTEMLKHLEGIKFKDRRRLVTPLKELQSAAPMDWPVQ